MKDQVSDLVIEMYCECLAFFSRGCIFEYMETFSFFLRFEKVRLFGANPSNRCFACREKHDIDIRFVLRSKCGI